MTKHLALFVRLLIAAAGIAYILYTLNWTSRIALPDGGWVAVEGVDGPWLVLAEPLDPGLGVTPEPGSDGRRVRRADLEQAGTGRPSFKPAVGLIIREARLPLLLGGLCLITPAFLIGSMRWTILMRARGIDASYRRSLRLTLAGQFFDLCMPGTTGGDVMKAIYAAKATDQRADAVVSVAVDRACGLVGLMLLVALVGLFSLDDPVLHKLTLMMWALLFVLLLGGWLYTHPALRRGLRLGRLLGKLPGAGVLRKADALVTAYRNHKAALLAAVLMSLPIHLTLALSMTLAGYALGVDMPLLLLIGTVPVVLLMWALPVSGPLGLGPLDIVAVQLITGGGGATPQQAVMMFVAYRLYAVAVGLSGSLMLLGPNAPRASAMRKQNEPSSEAGA